MTGLTLVKAYLRLVRIHAGIAAAVLVLISAVLTNAHFPPETYALLVGAVLLATSGGNALNDVYDCEIDRISKPDRPLPSGAISPRAATALSMGLFSLAVICSARISLWCLALCIGNVIALTLYAMHSKRIGFFKDLLVGYLVGSVTLFGATRLDLLNIPIVTLAACAMLATIARELVKDIEDKAGDARDDARTVPILIGDRRTYAIAYACLAAAVAVALVPYLLGQMGGRYVVMICTGGAVFVASLLSSHAETRQKLIMTGSVIDMAAFYVGAV